MFTIWYCDRCGNYYIYDKNHDDYTHVGVKTVINCLKSGEFHKFQGRKEVKNE